MARLRTRYVYSLVFISIVVCGILVFGVISLCLAGGNLASPACLLCLAVFPLAYIIWQWMRLLKGTVLIERMQQIKLDGGTLVFEEPTCRYEVWLYCEVPLWRYRGEISVGSIGSKVNQVVTIPQGMEYMYRLRPNFKPVIVRSPAHPAGALSQCLITFDLRPRFQCDSMSDQNLRVLAVIKTV
jgi:hypothetical protein